MSNDKQTGKDEKLPEENKNPAKDTLKQEQSDPQLTELRGFVKADEDLEPTLTDGQKSPDKAGDENAS